MTFLKQILTSSSVSRILLVQMRNCSNNAKFRKVGFVGLGNMGSRMSANLLKKGYDVIAFDANPAAMASLQGSNYTPAKDLNHLASESDCIVTMLPSGPIVLEAFAKMKNSLREGTLVVECSTIDPSETITLTGNLKNIGIPCIDAPVSGGVNGAEKGTLTFMVGGETNNIEKAEEILLSMGSKIFHCGGSGAGQAAKVCNNLLLAISMAGLSEAMLLGKQLGLDVNVLRDIINTSSGRCWSSEVYSPVPGTLDNVPSSNNYQGGFSSKIMLKDLHLANAAAKKTGVPLPLGSSAADLYTEIDKSKLSGLDFSVIYKYLESKLSD